MGRACSAYGERRGLYRVLVGKPERKRTLRRLRLRWDDNIKIDLQDVECGVMNWIKLAHNRDSWRQLVGTCECGNKPLASIKCGELLG
jgi:hypothetical protein